MRQEHNVVTGETTEHLDAPLPVYTQAELDEQAIYASLQYQRDRAEAYPSLTEQADMAYWDRQNGTTTLDDAISAVKDAYPKPV